MLSNILVILCLITVNAFSSISEISLATSRKIKLKLLADEGSVNARHVSEMQESPGMFFIVVQIGPNVVAILDDIIGDTTFSPASYSLFSKYFTPELSKQLGFILSFSLVTGLFILFVNLTPKRISMITPGAVTLCTTNPIRFCLSVFRPLVWFFNGLTNNISRLFKVPMVRKGGITSDDIYAMVEADALADVLRKQEHELIENVFELESRTVPSSVTSRKSIIWFGLREDEQSLKDKVAEHPHSRFLVCNENIDHIIGYADSRDLLNRVLANQSMALDNDVQIRNMLIVSDTLTLSEALESFKTVGEDFAVITDECALVVGIITLNDVMITLMDGLVGQGLEEQIAARDESSRLVDGGTSIDDVMRVLDIDEFPQSGNYEAVGGSMIFILREVPKHADSVKYSGYKFEMVDTDNYRIDQLLVTRLDSKPTVLVSELPGAKEEAKTP